MCISKRMDKQVMKYYVTVIMNHSYTDESQNQMIHQIFKTSQYDSIYSESKGPAV